LIRNSSATKEYRFSEDLDYTLTVEASIDPSFIHAQLLDVTRWLYENTGIEVPEIIIDVFPETTMPFTLQKSGWWITA